MLGEAVEAFRYLAEGSDAQVVANTIMQQMYGSVADKWDRMALRSGNKSVYAISAGTKMEKVKSTGPGVQFDARGHWKGRVLIRLDANDTYTVVFGRVRKKRGSFDYQWKVDKQVSGIYADQLGEIVVDNVLMNGIRK